MSGLVSGPQPTVGLPGLVAQLPAQAGPAECGGELLALRLSDCEEHPAAQPDQSPGWQQCGLHLSLR